MTIFSLLICLFAVLAMRTTCAEGVANLFRAMEPSTIPDGGTRDAAPAATPENH